MWRVIFANDLVTSLICELDAEIRAVPELYRHTNALMHERRQAMPQRYCLDKMHRELRSLCAELSFRCGAPEGVTKGIPADSRTGRAFTVLQKRMCDGRVYADAVNGSCLTYKNAM